MRKVWSAMLCVALVALVGAAVWAQETAPKGKTHDMSAVFVSFDAKAKTVTFKDMEGKEKTAPVMDAALRSLSALKAGDKITITCQDNEKGEHQAVSMVKPAMEKHG